MKPTHAKLKPLLDDMLAAEDGHGGPSHAEVLVMVRRERSRRQRRRIIGIAGTAVVLTLLPLFWISRDSPQPLPQLVHAEPAKSPTVVFQEINDDELVALLGATPSAVMEWPNGERTLLVVESGGGRVK